MLTPVHHLSPIACTRPTAAVPSSASPVVQPGQHNRISRRARHHAAGHSLAGDRQAAPRRVLCRIAEITRDLLFSSQDYLLDDSLESHLSLEGHVAPQQVVSSHQPQHTSPSHHIPAAVLSSQPLMLDEAPASQPYLLAEAKRLERLIDKLRALGSADDKVSYLLSQEPRVQAFAADPRHSSVMNAVRQLPSEEQYLLLCLPAMAQEHVLAAGQGTDASSHTLLQGLSKLATDLSCVEQFYDSVGGVLGYQQRSLDLIIEGTQELREAKRKEQPGTQQASEAVDYHVPRALDLAGEGGREVGSRTAAAGLQALPHMAEIYPVGGAGDRLGLTCSETGECLPAAMLPYCGRTMLEGLMRDLMAREYLYYRLTGRQVTTPVAIMSSEAKGNHQRIQALMEKLGWFGRGRGAFRIFKQPLVPVINTSNGTWLLNDVHKPMTKPGGHGAIWKLMWDQGVFAWFKTMNRSAALVRQISNPMAGMDTTLLALAGCGASRTNSAFGFMSCDRTLGAAEGCNVLLERKVTTPEGRTVYEYGYTNIEYTEFDRLGISDQPVDGNSRRSVFPANTNVLYVGLKAAEQVIQTAIASSSSEQLMPGLIFNLKKEVTYKDPLTGEAQKLHAGRMECTMQNIADYMADKLDTKLSSREASQRELSTFLVYNMRRKVTSSAKKKRVPGSTRISQTPDGSFYDLQRNAWHLLQQCGVQDVPELGSVEQYLQQGPGFIFLFNPALGPLWDVISQKLVGGSMQQGSEMVLEVAEACLQQVHVSGSFLVYAENVMGHMEPVHGEPGGRLSYSLSCGRISMSNVVINNAGIDWQAPDNLYWKHQVTRKEAVQVLLKGNSEFEAHDVTLTGAHTFEVPDGYRMVVSQDYTGCLQVNLTPLAWGMPTWHWAYNMSPAGDIRLQYTSQQTGGNSLLSSSPLGHKAGARGGRWRSTEGLVFTSQQYTMLQQISEIDGQLDFMI